MSQYNNQIFPITITLKNGNSIEDDQSFQSLNANNAIFRLKELFWGNNPVFGQDGYSFTIRDNSYDFTLAELRDKESESGRISKINIIENLFRIYYTVAKDFIAFTNSEVDTFSISLKDDKSILISHNLVTDDNERNFGITFKLLREQLCYAQRQKYLLSGQYFVNKPAAEEGFFFVYPQSNLLSTIPGSEL